MSTRNSSSELTKPERTELRTRTCRGMYTLVTRPGFPTIEVIAADDPFWRNRQLTIPIRI